MGRQGVVAAGRRRQRRSGPLRSGATSKGASSPRYASVPASGWWPVAGGQVARLVGSATASSSWPTARYLVALSPSPRVPGRAASPFNRLRGQGQVPHIPVRGARVKAWSRSAPSPDTGPLSGTGPPPTGREVSGHYPAFATTTSRLTPRRAWAGVSRAVIASPADRGRPGQMDHIIPATRPPRVAMAMRSVSATLGAHVVGQGTADNAAAEQVDHRGQVQPALAGGH